MNSFKYPYLWQMNQEMTATANAVSTTTFGKQPTDHMFLAEYKNGVWNPGQLKKFQKILLSPFALCFHYGQTVFEGMKSFKMNDGRISIFRPKRHFERLNVSLERMCMPELTSDFFLDAISQVIKTDQS